MRWTVLLPPHNGILRTEGGWGVVGGCVMWCVWYRGRVDSVSCLVAKQSALYVLRYGRSAGVEFSLMLLVLNLRCVRCLEDGGSARADQQ